MIKYIVKKKVLKTSSEQVVVDFIFVDDIFKIIGG